MSPEQAKIYLPCVYQEWKLDREELQSERSLVIDLTARLDAIRTGHNEEQEGVILQLKGVQKQLEGKNKTMAADIGAKDDIIKRLQERIDRFEQQDKPELERVKLENSDLRCKLIAYQNPGNESAFAKSEGINKEAMQKRLAEIELSLGELKREIEQIESENTTDDAKLIVLDEKIDIFSKEIGTLMAGESRGFEKEVEKLEAKQEPHQDERDKIKRRMDGRSSKLRAKESKIEKLKKEQGDLFVLLDGGGSKSSSRSGDAPELWDGSSVTDSTLTYDQSQKGSSISSSNKKSDKRATSTKPLGEIRIPLEDVVEEPAG